MPETPGWQQFAVLVVFMVGLLIMFWWVVIRPTQSRQKKHQDLVTSIMPGDEIITVGGIHGVVNKVSEKSIKVEIAQGVIITIDRRAIRRLQGQEDF